MSRPDSLYPAQAGVGHAFCLAVAVLWSVFLVTPAWAVCSVEPKANCPHAELYGANLARADFPGAYLVAAELYQADLTGANLKDSNIAQGKLMDANLTGADLSGARLEYANFSRAILKGAKLNNATLTGANLSWSDLTGADLKGAYLSGVVYCHTRMPNGDLNNTNCPSEQSHVDAKKVTETALAVKQPAEKDNVAADDVDSYPTWVEAESSPKANQDAKLDHDRVLPSCARSEAQCAPSEMYRIGEIYAKGNGVAKDFRRAVYWYRKAAEQGDAPAQFSLGLMYDIGQGVTQDYKQAMLWYGKAVEQGNLRAQNNLGFMYSMGKGVAKDYVTAHMWFNIAGARGYEDGRKNRDFLERLMTPEQISAAQQRAAEWMRKPHD